MEARNLGTFVLGVCTGLGIAGNWRPALRESMRHTIVGTAYLSRSVLRYAEDLSDAVHEARFAGGAGAVGGGQTAIPPARDSSEGRGASGRSGLASGGC